MPLIAALIALLAGVLGVTIGGVLSHRSALRQQHRAWLREQRFQSCVDFYDLMNRKTPGERWTTPEAFRFYTLASNDMIRVFNEADNSSSVDKGYELRFAIITQLRKEYGSAHGQLHPEAERFIARLREP